MGGFLKVLTVYVGGRESMPYQMLAYYNGGVREAGTRVGQIQEAFLKVAFLSEP